MRRVLTFECDGHTLFATVDNAPGTTGLLIVSGGNEIRIGAHRGMARLARDVAAAGYPVFRFDRRGVGDSDGSNTGFTASHHDIDAAIKAFTNACPQIDHCVGFGNCDAATALILHPALSVRALVLANPWIIDTPDELPPAAAIRARYLDRVKDPQAWRRLITGSVDLRKLAQGLRKMRQTPPQSDLASTFAGGLSAFTSDITLVIAARDNTAIAFMDAWRKPLFEDVRQRSNVVVTAVDSASHSFASDDDHAVLLSTVLATLRQ